MTDPDPSKHDGRLDTMLPGIPLGAKAALLAGLAGGLFGAIVMSYVDSGRQYQVLAVGIAIGSITALVLMARHWLRQRDS